MYSMTAGEHQMEKDNIEITRSFSQKVNLGNYSTADFFCSRKEECKKEDAEKVSEEAYKFCKQQVEKDIINYNKERQMLSETEKAYPKR